MSLEVGTASFGELLVMSGWGDETGWGKWNTLA